MGGPDLTLLDGVAWQGTALASGRARELLAALALAAPRSASVADLVAAVWDDDEPAHPDKALQVLVSRVRSQTGSESVVRLGTGYRLELRDDQVDLLMLRRLVDGAAAARAAGDLDVARLQAREALGLPLTTTAEHGSLGEVVAQARILRARAGQLLGRVLLARGDAAEALPLLEAAAGQAPDDEARVADVLRAEAQVRGIPAALARYASYAERVADELGATPGEELQRLHGELLARDAPVRQGLKYDATPLLGRDDDVVRLRGLLGQSRVVSIVGAGGLGKTRMAHLVGRLAQQPVVHFVELAGVTAGDGVLLEVAGALGVRESATERRAVQLRADLRGRLAEQLAGPPTLLVLDNCEHVVGAVADLVAFVVASTDATAVLTTSRAPLGIAAEHVYLLPELDEAAAVALFEERARSARPGVRLEREEVTALVARLDGLPLAIELAAAKVRAMSVAEIARRLGDRFALLSGHDRSAPDRHQTLENVIAWSWNLLDTHEQRALRTLAVFPDGFSLEGAEGLLGHDPLPAVGELVDQSLLVVREDASLRYRFLETVREYGLKQLEEAGETAAVRDRLRTWTVRLTRGLLARLFTREQIATLPLIRAEAGTIAGVMRAALDAGDDEEASDAIPLVGVLFALWTIEGDHLAALELAREVADVIMAVPAEGPSHEAELRGVLCAAIVMISVIGGQGRPVLLERLVALGLAGDGSRVDAFTRLLVETWADGEISLQRLDLLCEDSDPATARAALMWSTQMHENVGELAEARLRADRALQMSHPDDGPWMRAMVESQAAGLAAQAGEWTDVVEHAGAAIPVMEALGALEDVWQLRSLIGFAHIVGGRLDEAAAVFGALAVAEAADGSVGWRLSSLTGEAELALARGEVETGLQLFLESLAAVERRVVPGLDDTLSPLTPWVLYAEAAVLFAHVRHGRREAIGWLADRLQRKLPRLLGAERLMLDHPVLGGVLLALGCWSITGAPTAAAAEAACRLVALGERFGYHRALPTMAWANVRAVVDPHANRRLDALVADYAERGVVDLLEVAQDAIVVVAQP